MFATDVLALENDLISWRRTLHELAELSFEEYETTAFLEKMLRSFGITDIRRPCKTGLIASVYGEKSGTSAALGIRADIDALPICEKTQLPFSSKNHGVMHACGHDGHAAMALAAAKLLQENRDKFCGEVRFLFQHAEELPPGGAIEMVKAGAADGLDAVLGLHLSSVFPSGVFGVRSGALTANTDRFDITIHGRGGHCAYREQCIDPIVTGAQVICALQAIPERIAASNEPCVLSVCKTEAGNAYNIIPNDMSIVGTTRTLGPTARACMKREMEQTIRNITQSVGASYTFSWQEGYPSVINDVSLTQMAENNIAKRFGADAVLHIDPQMPGEDFPYFLETGKRPGFFVELGTRRSDNGCDMPHHNPLYKLDEDALKFGVQYLVDMAQTLLSGERRYV